MILDKISFELKPENFDSYYRKCVRSYGFYKIFVLLISLLVVWLEIKLGRKWVNAYIFTLFCHVQSAWADDIVHATGLI